MESSRPGSSKSALQESLLSVLARRLTRSPMPTNFHPLPLATTAACQCARPPIRPSRTSGRPRSQHLLAARLRRSAPEVVLEVDLDRAVVARKIRVIFPQTENARPFEFFSLHVSRASKSRARRVRKSRLSASVARSTTTPSRWSSSISEPPVSPSQRNAQGAILGKERQLGFFYPSLCAL